MNHWKPVSDKDAEEAEKLTYEPMFHWHGLVNFIAYMTMFISMFQVFKFLTGLI